MNIRATLQRWENGTVKLPEYADSNSNESVTGREIGGILVKVAYGVDTLAETQIPSEEDTRVSAGSSAELTQPDTQQ